LEKIGTDLEIWALLKGGDRSAYNFIYQREISHLINYGRKLTQQIELIEDAVYDMFIYIWINKAKLSDTDSIRRYLLVSFKNKLISNLKKKNKVSYQEDSFAFFENNEPSSEDLIISKEISRERQLRLQESYANLSKRQKEAIFLKYHERMDYKDICQIMNINNQSARNLIISGLKKLQIAFSEK